MQQGYKKLFLFIFSLQLLMLSEAQTGIVINNCTITAAQKAKYPLLNNFLTYSDGNKASLKYFNYHKNGRFQKRPGAIYLSREAVFFLNDFFANDTSNSNRFQALNIHFMQYNRIVASGQLYKNQTLLYITPDSSQSMSDIKKPDFDTLFNFFLSRPKTYNKDVISKVKICPGFCDLAFKRFKDVSTGTPSVERLDDLFFLSNGAVLALKDNYKNDRAGEAGSKQTTTVTVTRNVIFRLAGFLNNYNSQTYPLVSIAFINYGILIPGTGQTNAQQTHLDFSPVKYQDNIYQSDPCEYIAWLLANDRYLLMPLIKSGENHGTLCPNVCPPGGN